MYFKLLHKLQSGQQNFSLNTFRSMLKKDHTSTQQHRPSSVFHRCRIRQPSGNAKPRASVNAAARPTPTVINLSRDGHLTP